MMERPGKRASSMGDRLSGLPDELLHRVVSFLPARETVRTCVLAPRWRRLWASARRLNVRTMGFTRMEDLTQYVNNLLLRRGHAPLDAFCLCADDPRITPHSFSDTANLWIYHAVRCNIQELGIIDYSLRELEGEETHRTFYPDRCSFVSSHLKRLHLCSVGVKNCFIKQLFSGCTVLEDLEMINCDITATEFSSTTLKSLSINSVEYPWDIGHMVIDMPSLVSLYIGKLDDPKPSFINMRSLLSASISITDWRFKFSVGCDILGAFSNVRNLKLTSTCPMATADKEFLGNDKLFCQVEFTNLTTLSLGDWCLHHSCQALLYLLQHSPNLEKLTLTLSMVRPLTSYEQFSDVTPFNCKKLQKIEIICSRRFNDNVAVVVAILCDHLISLPEIDIKPC